ncbi:MAG: hypothetical protein C5B50_07090 [Verrucomicrobia bacterium]|nr:MAG: hypothetical protein C5B50_07090 [Verrucomicrobiota bacterium]
MVLSLTLGLTQTIQAQIPNEPLETFVVTDGQVNALAINSNMLYFGGQFNFVGARTGSGVPVTATTGQAEAVYPSINGDVFTAVNDGQGGWFVGGSFSVAGGFLRTNLVHIRSDRTVDPNWAPVVAGGRVYSLILSAGTLYVGGGFTNVSGQTRNRLAALDSSSGALLSWNPNANSNVRTMALTSSNMYIGGEFTTLGAQTRNHIGAVDLTMGQLAAWNPGAGDWVYAMTLSAGHLYVGGYFTSMSGQSRGYAASFDLSTGSLDSWNPGASSDVWALDAYQNVIFMGGLFTAAGGSNRTNIAAVDATTGLATSWDARLSINSGGSWVTALKVYSNALYVGGIFQSIGGQPREMAAALDLTTANATAWDAKVNLQAWAFAGAGNTLYLGGQFGAAGCVTRTNLAAFDLLSGRVTSWSPSVAVRNGVPVNAMVIASNALFIGGYFNTVGGLTRSNLASLDLNTGAVLDWSPNPYNATIYSLATWSDRLFVGGTFNNISGIAQNYFAEFDLSTLMLTGWNPFVSGFVQAMAVDGDTLYIGGNFGTVSGQTRRRVATFDLTSETLTSWDAGLTTGQFVDAITVSSGKVYLGGYFSVINGSNRTNFVALDASTAQVLPLVANCDQPIYALAASSNYVFLGGNFRLINGQSRPFLVALDANANALTSWIPGPDQYPKSLRVQGNTLYSGGWFLHAGGETTISLAAFPLGLMGNPYIVTNSMQRPVSSAPQFRLVALGIPQASVLGSTNLNNWQLLQSVPLVDGNGQFVDTDSTTRPKRFYRISVP